MEAMEESSCFGFSELMCANQISICSETISDIILFCIILISDINLICVLSKVVLGSPITVPQFLALSITIPVTSFNICTLTGLPTDKIHIPPRQYE